MADPPANRVPVVGLGASAGGIEAFRKFFEKMPPKSGLAFVVVLHLPIDGKSLLPELISRWTRMPVSAAEDGIRVEVDHVYVPPPGVVVNFHNGCLHLIRLEPGEPREFSPITILFNSLAESLGEDAIGIVLSGTGSDGSLGLKAIKEKGGVTFVQGSNGTVPQHDGMPNSAIATGAVDVIASVEDLPARLIARQDARRNPDTLKTLEPRQIDAARLAICDILNRQVGHDFSAYKDKTFMRRVQRRMHVLGLTSLDQFVDRLEHDREQIVMLFSDLLIGVTGFFRDQETFETLRTKIIPRLFDKKEEGSSIRVWVPGCATGEEAYSLAMLLREHADRLARPGPTLQVFATDIDEPGIATARAGRYPSTLLQGVSEERLQRHFVHGVDGSYTVAKPIREMCTFSAHSLTRDPPFSRIDLVSCRNLLIYLNIDLQSMVIPAFHYALRASGILLLGSAETINRHETLFETLDRPHRIFAKRDVPSPPLTLTGRKSARDGQKPPSGKRAEGGAMRPAGARPYNWAAARVLDHFAPSFVVVTADGAIIHNSSRVGRYLDFPPGSPSQNILVMARKGLTLPLRAALKQAAESGRTAEIPNVAMIGAGGETVRLTLIVEPRREQGADTQFLLVFLESAQAKADPRQPPPGGEIADFEPDRDLEAELRDTQEQLQSLTEEHDTALEELRSANEELHSVNEELQSTNEELETSKEEIQSINEELQTVNSQLASKVDELDRKNSDLRNLFQSTQVATVFLDPYMIIRSFTPALTSIYNLIPSDHGRPLTDIVSRLRYQSLTEDCGAVMQSLQPLERRVVRDDDDTHYLMKIVPYRTPESTVDGTIVTFVDVTTMVKAEQHQRLLVDELNHRVKNMLTVVISMATQTLRRSGSLEDFSHAYLGRIHALTAAYSLLSNENWQSVSIRTLLMEELKPFLAPEQTNVTLDGPRVLLEPRPALALGMAIHELTTNAVKYGALSVPEGSVAIAWRTEDTALILEWMESNGPPVSPPAYRGFGMTLIERGLKQDMSASVHINFPTEGVRAVLQAPLSAGALGELSPDAQFGESDR